MTSDAACRSCGFHIHAPTCSVIARPAKAFASLEAAELYGLGCEVTELGEGRLCVLVGNDTHSVDTPEQARKLLKRLRGAA